MESLEHNRHFLDQLEMISRFKLSSLVGDLRIPHKLDAFDSKLKAFKFCLLVDI